MTVVFTIGYEGAEIAAFIAELHAAGIDTIADVRALPLSRKKGFSKRALKDHLEINGIRYRHLPKLGDPKAGRDAARAGRYAEFRRIYGAHLELDETRESLSELARIVRSGTTCLMCFERDPAVCHRTMVLEWLVRDGVKGMNLFVGPGGGDRSQPARRSHRHSCESTTPA